VLLIGEKKDKSNPLQITIASKPKTLSLILKILIQNRVLGVNFKYKTYRQEDTKHQRRREA
jgi:hypothetical protein